MHQEAIFPYKPLTSVDTINLLADIRTALSAALCVDTLMQAVGWMSHVCSIRLGYSQLSPYLQYPSKFWVLFCRQLCLLL